MKPIWFILGWISFILGLIGAFIPVLPTTPFLILATFLFSKSSPKFHQWMLDLPNLGPGIRDWQNNRVIKPRAKILCTIMIAFSLTLISLNSNILMLIKIGVIISVLSVWLYVVTRKSK